MMDFTKLNIPNHPAIQKYAVSINNQCEAANVPPCALAAIVANETGGQNIFQHGMPHSAGCGVGLTQITAGVDWTNPAQPTYHMDGHTWALLDTSSNLYVAAKYFIAPAMAEFIQYRIEHSTMPVPEILYYVFAGFNEGVGAVEWYLRHGEDPDVGTSDHYATRALEYYHTFLSESHTHKG